MNPSFSKVASLPFASPPPSRSSKHALWTLLFLATALLAIAGCGSSPGEATNENFKSALNDYYASNEQPCFDAPEGFPQTVGLTSEYPEHDQNSHRMKHEDYGALVSAGLASAQNTTIREPEKFYGRDSVSRKAKRYTLTEQGREYLKTSDSNFGGTDYEICFGHRQVEAVNNFSSPSQMRGRTVSEVKYSYRIAEQPEWLETSGLQEAFPDLANMLEGEPPRDGEDMMVKTNNGWVHIGAYEE